MKTIALIDPHWEGHHSVYLKLYSEALLELGFKVFVLCPQPDTLQKKLKFKNFKNKHNIYFSYFSSNDIGNKNKIMQYIATLGLWRKTNKKIQELENKHSVKFDNIFFLWLDSYLYPGVSGFIVDLIFRHKWAGLYFHPNHFRTTKDRIHKLINPSSALQSSNCRMVAVLDENVKVDIEKYISKKNIAVFPDITNEENSYTKTKLRKDIELKAKGRPIIGLFGSLEKRKGILSIIKVINNYESNKYFYILQGPLYESTFTDNELKEVKQFIKDPPENCKILNKSIPDGNQFNCLMNVCDILYLVYINFYHSSNMLTKAALLRKTVIVSKGHLMEERVNKYKLGVAVDNEDITLQLKAINNLLKSEDLNNKKLFPKFGEYLEMHSYEKLMQTLNNNLI